MPLLVSAGPIPNDDWLQVIVAVTGGAGLTFGTKITHGALSVSVVIGIDEKRTGANLGLQMPGVADGTALTLQANQYHANGTFVQGTGFVTGWAWDPTSGLFALINPDAGAGGILSDILAAVRIVRTTPGQ